MKKIKPSDLPKISIVIPSYNKADYIGKTLESIINQNYPCLEIIIQDGGSTDGSIDLIKKFAKKYPQIIIWVSGKDGGQLDAINQGLCKATGHLLTYINADDVYQKGALLSMGKAFIAHPQALWLTGLGDIIDKNDKQISAWVTGYKNILLKINSYWLLLLVNYITQPATFISKEAYIQYGPFSGTKKYVMEYDLWLKLGKVQMPIVVKKNIARFRLTMDNISATSFKDLLKIDNEIAKKYTKNNVILFLHSVHNFGRVGLISWIKRT